MKSQNLGLAAIFLWVALIFAAMFGWVVNIIEIIHSSAITGMLIARIIGVFVAPVGAVLGYF